MKINKNDFEKSKNGEKWSVNFNNGDKIPVTLHAVTLNNFKAISLTAYLHKCKEYYSMGTVYSIEDLNQRCSEIRNKLVGASYFCKNCEDYKPILNELAVNTIKRTTRLNVESDDGKIKMCVQKGKNKKGTFQPMVYDFTVYSDGNISKETSDVALASYCSTEQEAEDIVKNAMVEYNTYGYYTRLLPKKSNVIKLHEKAFLKKEESTNSVKLKHVVEGACILFGDSTFNVFDAHVDIRIVKGVKYLVLELCDIEKTICLNWL